MRQMFFSSTPTVDTKYPGDQTMFSFQYRFFNHPNFFLSSLLVIPFNFPTTSLTAYLGGIIITICMRSGCILYLIYLIISHPGICSSTVGNSFSRYAFTPEFRMRSRYFGIKLYDTLSYMRYDRIAEFPPAYFITHVAITLIHPRASTWNSALRVCRDANNRRDSSPRCYSRIELTSLCVYLTLLQTSFRNFLTCGRTRSEY